MGLFDVLACSQWFLVHIFEPFMFTTASGARTEVLKEQQPPAVPVSSPPTQDRETGLCHRTSCAARFTSLSPRSSSHSHNRSVCKDGRCFKLFSCIVFFLTLLSGLGGQTVLVTNSQVVLWFAWSLAKRFGEFETCKHF